MNENQQQGDAPSRSPDSPVESLTESGSPRATGPISLDDLFDVLRNPRRRAVLGYLRDCGGETTLSDLAEAIAATENEKSIAALRSQERKRVYISLYQSHLPKMDRTGLIDFDDNRGTVVACPPIEHAYALLPSATEEAEPDRQWPFYYLGQTILSLSLLLVALLSGWISAEIALLFTIVGFTAITLTHLSISVRR